MRRAADARAGFALALAGPGQPDAAIAALSVLVAVEVGARLFTVMTFDEASGLSRRHWSNMPEAYSPGGTKPLQRDGWADQVLGRHEPFVANDIGAIAAVFADHELIASLGCESCLNLPVVVGGEVLGTLNCLHEAGHYTPERVARAREALAVPGAACLLARLLGDSKGGPA